MGYVCIHMVSHKNHVPLHVPIKYCCVMWTASCCNPVKTPVNHEGSVEKVSVMLSSQTERSAVSSMESALDCLHTPSRRLWSTVSLNWKPRSPCTRFCWHHEHDYKYCNSLYVETAIPTPMKYLMAFEQSGAPSSTRLFQGHGSMLTKSSSSFLK